MFQYNCQQNLQIRKDEITLIPNDCKIAKERLMGLSNDEFVEAFAGLQKLVLDLYTNIIDNPEQWEYPLEPFKGSTSPGDYNSTKYERLTDVFKTISNGRLENGQLIVDITEYKSKLKKHKKHLVMLQKLQEFGFQIQGMERGAQQYIISYPDQPDILTVLVSYTQAMQEIGSDPMYSIYSYRVVQDRSQQKYDKIFHAMTDFYTPEAREACVKLIEESKAYGYEYIGWYNDCHYKIAGTKDGKTFLTLYYNVLEKNLYTKIIVRRMLEDENIEFIYALPEKLQRAFMEESSLCTCCHGQKDPKGECTMRIKFNWHGKPRKCCAYNSFYFKDLNKDDLPYLIDLYVKEFKIKR